MMKGEREVKLKALFQVHEEGLRGGFRDWKDSIETRYNGKDDATPAGEAAGEWISPLLVECVMSLEGRGLFGQQ